MVEIHVRRATKNDIRNIAKVHVDSWKTTYKGIFANEILDNVTLTKEKSNGKTFFKKKTIYNIDL